MFQGNTGCPRGIQDVPAENTGCSRGIQDVPGEYRVFQRNTGCSRKNYRVFPENSWCSGEKKVSKENYRVSYPYSSPCMHNAHLINLCYIMSES